MKHFLNTQDWSRAELEGLLRDAERFQREPNGDALRGKTMALLFFNPSLRTRTQLRDRDVPPRRPRRGAAARQGRLADRVR